MKISGITRGSYVNGPGRRNVLHVQGCTIGCPACFNKHTWPSEEGIELTPLSVALELLFDSADSDCRTPCQGLTISGGEPMEQWESVKEVVEKFLYHNLATSVIIFTGWTRIQLEKSGRLEEMSSSCHANNHMISMVVSGPYVEKLACNSPMISSSNQELIYTNPHYKQVDLSDLPRVEVHCEEGQTKILGLPDSDTLDELTKEV